jgi:hypothetical protein
MWLTERYDVEGAREAEYRIGCDLGPGPALSRAEVAEILRGRLASAGRKWAIMLAAAEVSLQAWLRRSASAEWSAVEDQERCRREIRHLTDSEIPICRRLVEHYQIADPAEYGL